MGLLEIETIQNELDEQFLPLEPMLTGTRLIPKGGQQPALAACQQQLGVHFPSSFSSLATRFDFGSLTIGPVAFGNGRDYFDVLIEGNKESCSQHGLAWWSGATRPQGQVMIANAESIAIVLDTTTGVIHAFDHGSNAAHAMFAIADNFEHFVRGVGTCLLRRSRDGGNESLAQSVASAVGVDPNNRFWEYIAN